MLSIFIRSTYLTQPNNASGYQIDRTLNDRLSLAPRINSDSGLNREITLPV